MIDFWLWFSTGLTHILDLNGYDHILFVSLLVFCFKSIQFKQLFILISAFTIGHTITLALSTYNIVIIPQIQIELLISLSILITALINIININKEPKSNYYIFGLTALFGLIHGLGFSYLLKNMLGKEENIILPLLYFNLGLEVGQILIVSVIILLTMLLAKLLKQSFKSIKITISTFVALLSLYLVICRSLDLFN